MTLFTDGSPASIDDLRRYDSSAESLAHDAGINLDAKLSVAAEEVGQDVFSFLLFQSSPNGSGGSLFQNSVPGEATRQKIGLSDVMVTPALRRWHALRTLAGLYRDAYCSDVTDRFRLKWEEYEKLAKDASDYSFTTGIGLSRSPVPKAPVAVVTETSATVDRTDYSVRLTWVNSGGAEGAPSDSWHASLGSGDRIAIVGPAPSTITGWNVYLAAENGAPLQQNVAPVSPDEAWTNPGGTLRQGKTLLEGQPPDYIVVERRTLLRG
jgi:hypothetical protein